MEIYELTTPWLSACLVHRSNPLSSTPEEYYRICPHDEFLSLVAELEKRLVNNPSFSIVLGFLYLVPSKCVHLEFVGSIPEDLAKAVKLYKSHLPHTVMHTTEYGSWVREWKVCSTVPDTLVGDLYECSSSSHPNLSVLLKIALTLTITSYESKRSFS